MSTFGKLASDLGKLVSDFVDKLPDSLLGQPSLQVTGSEPLQVMTPRAYVINFDPVMDLATGERLTQRMAGVTSMNSSPDILPILTSAAADSSSTASSGAPTWIPFRPRWMDSSIPPMASWP